MHRGIRLWVAATVALLVATGVAIAAVSMNFNSPMEGAQEAPVPRDTQARGNAVYKLSADGNRVQYKVIVANIENVFMAHIHMAPPGVSGPIVVWLYPSTTPGVMAPLGGGRIDGVIVQGIVRGLRPGRSSGGPSALRARRSHAERRRVYERPHERRRPGRERGPGRLPRGRDPRSDQGERAQLGASRSAIRRDRAPGSGEGPTGGGEREGRDPPP